MLGLDALWIGSLQIQLPHSRKYLQLWSYLVSKLFIVQGLMLNKSN